MDELSDIAQFVQADLATQMDWEANCEISVLLNVPW
jgi:hypothetical protein